MTAPQIRPTSVLPACDDLHMVGIDTASIPADSMVDTHPRRNRLSDHLVRDTVRHLRTTTPVRPTVSALHEVPGPVPAASIDINNVPVLWKRLPHILMPKDKTVVGTRRLSPTPARAVLLGIHITSLVPAVLTVRRLGGLGLATTGTRVLHRFSRHLMRLLSSSVYTNSHTLGCVQ
jgi:hypothetical protein